MARNRVVRCLLLSVGATLFGPFATWAQSLPIATFALGLPIPWEECRTRVSRALTAEGYSGLVDFGNGWEASGRGGLVSVSCLAGSGETIVSIVTSGPTPYQPTAERAKLMDRIRSDSAPAPMQPAAPPPLRSIGQGWGVDGGSVRGRVRERFTVTCTPQGSLGPAWGTDVYTDDSSVCTAAVHAGAITVRTGGTVTFEMRPGQAAYRGSTRNGVASMDYGAWESSFVIVRSPTPMATGGTGWSATATSYRGRNGERFSFICAAGGPAGGAWGTDTYTDESSVCAAGVHAGIISLFNGGTVMIEVRPGADSYEGSTRNGLTSLAFGASPGSFVLVR